MEQQQQTVLLEAPREVSLAQLEQELTLLWKQAENSRGDGIHPVVRACTMNLIVVTEDEAGGNAIADMIGEVTLEHPARIFLVILDRKEKKPSLNAWISARCAIPEPGQEQVCCEQITLVARGTDVEKITSAVTSLLVSDVSTMLLWKTSIDASDPTLRSLLAVTDRALIDSSEELKPLPALLAWRELVHADIGMATLGDLGWTHVTAWRAIISQAFEQGEVRALMHELDTVTIEYSVTQAPRHSGFSQALLLVGWLARAFEWKNTGTPGEVHDGSVRGTLHRGEQPVEIQLNLVPSNGNDPGGIERIVIAAGTKFRLELQEMEPRSEIVMTESRDGREDKAVVPLRTLSESELMARELEILERDPVYERSLEALALLASAGRRP